MDRSGSTCCEHQARNAVRLLDRERLADRSSGRIAHDVRAFDFERVHKLREFGRHLVDRENALQAVAVPHTALIVGDDFVTRRKCGDLRLPVAPHPAQTADEYQRVSLARHLVVDFTVRDCNLRMGFLSPAIDLTRYCMRTQRQAGNTPSMPQLPPAIMRAVE